MIVTPAAAPADGPNDPANQVLLAVAQEFATPSAATLVAGSALGLRAVGQRDLGAAPQQRLQPGVERGQRGHHARPDLTMWALANQLAGGKPNSYGISGASAVSPAPLPTPTATSTPTQTATPHSTTTRKAGAKK